MARLQMRFNAELQRLKDHALNDKFVVVSVTFQFTRFIKHDLQR